MKQLQRRDIIQAINNLSNTQKNEASSKISLNLIKILDTLTCGDNSNFYIFGYYPLSNEVNILSVLLRFKNVFLPKIIQSNTRTFSKLTTDNSEYLSNPIADRGKDLNWQNLGELKGFKHESECENSIQFFKLNHDTILKPNRYKIMEPVGGAPFELINNEKSIIIVPLLAFDKFCNRLGRGGGYYDKALYRKDKIIKIGCAFSIQELERINIDLHDIPLDFIITENTIFYKSSYTKY